MGSFGYVYILSNDAFQNDYYKIGMTTRSPNTRAFELYNKNTAVPGKFTVEFSIRVSDCALAEQRVHSQLSAYRLNNHRGFFKVPVSKARRVIIEVCEKIDCHPPQKESESGKQSLDVREKQAEGLRRVDVVRAHEQRFEKKQSAKQRKREEFVKNPKASPVMQVNKKEAQQPNVSQSFPKKKPIFTPLPPPIKKPKPWKAIFFAALAWIVIHFGLHIAAAADNHPTPRGAIAVMSLSGAALAYYLAKPKNTNKPTGAVGSENPSAQRIETMTSNNIHYDSESIEDPPKDKSVYYWLIGIAVLFFLMFYGMALRADKYSKYEDGTYYVPQELLNEITGSASHTLVDPDADDPPIFSESFFVGEIINNTEWKLTVIGVEVEFYEKNGTDLIATEVFSITKQISPHSTVYFSEETSLGPIQYEIKWWLTSARGIPPE